MKTLAQKTTLETILEEKKEKISSISGLDINYVEQRGVEILEFLRTIAPADHFGRTGNKSNSYYKLFNTIDAMCKTKAISLDYDFKDFSKENEVFTVGPFKNEKELNNYFKF